MTIDGSALAGKEILTVDALCCNCAGFEFLLHNFPQEGEVTYQLLVADIAKVADESFENAKNFLLSLKAFVENEPLVVHNQLQY